MCSKERSSPREIGSETDTHLWAERFDGEAGNLFALQAESSHRIAIALDLELIDGSAVRPIVLRGRAAKDDGAGPQGREVARFPPFTRDPPKP